MDFSFSDNWEWFFAILGAGVVVVAIFRAIFGKPKLKFEFYVENRVIGGNTGQVLRCRLWNSLFRNWVMKVLFVSRPRIDDVSVRCEVLDRSLTMSVVGKPFMADMVTVDGKVAKQLSLPASRLPVEFTILTYSNKDDVAGLRNIEVGDNALLDRVLYLVRVTAYLGDKQIKSPLAGFVIKGKIVLLKNLSESYAWGYKI